MKDLQAIVRELNAALNEHGGSGEFKTDAGKVFWLYSDNGDADTDHMWELYCEVSEILSKIGDYEIINSWNDHDSCGFDLKIQLMKENEENKFDPTLKYKLDPYDMKIYTLDQYIAACYGAATNLSVGLPSESMLEEQWLKLPDANIGYDSTADTLKHISRVNQLLGEAATELIRRGSVHDASKLSGDEKASFDEMTPKLAGATYGSDEYKGFLVELKVSLDHHYENNSHHPEHYARGVDEMDLFDILEMFFDWKAATERHNDGNIFKSLEYNKDRFKLSDQLFNIYWNTAVRLGYKKPEDGQKD